MGDKNWSYEAVTQSTENRIRSLVEQAATKPADEARTYRQWAYGAFLGWNHLTEGWQNSGDADRLESLIQNERG